jgi:hypothetical protein
MPVLAHLSSGCCYTARQTLPLLLERRSKSSWMGAIISLESYLTTFRCVLAPSWTVHIPTFVPALLLHFLAGVIHALQMTSITVLVYACTSLWPGNAM